MTLEKITDVVDWGLKWFLVILMGVAVVNVLWQVFTRFAIDAPSGFTEELARYLLIWIGILGSGYAAGQRAHLALELLPEQLEGRQLTRLRIVIELCVLLFAVVVMGIGGVRLVYTLFLSGQTSSSMGILVGYVYAVVPLTGLVITFYSAVHIVEELNNTPEPNDEAPAAAPPSSA